MDGRNYNLDALISLLGQPRQVKRRVFISYHHADQLWVDYFRKQFSQYYDVFADSSLHEAINSSNLDYVHRMIREDYITGSSLTIVICGLNTWQRKCVDWEIYSTLHKDHALLGVVLPHNRPPQNGRTFRIVPDRLQHNIESGYAHWIDWPSTSGDLSQAIQVSTERAKQYQKNNSMPRMLRNR